LQEGPILEMLRLDIGEVSMREEDTAINEPAQCHINITHPSEYCHRRYGRDTEARSCKCKSRAEGLIRLSMSLSSKFLPLLYVRETLQKR
jgi:hypothetical protein